VVVNDRLEHATDELERIVRLGLAGRDSHAANLEAPDEGLTP
jgi:hypothetical protein